MDKIAPHLNNKTAHGKKRNNDLGQTFESLVGSYIPLATSRSPSHHRLHLQTWGSRGDDHLIARTPGLLSIQGRTMSPPFWVRDSGIAHI
jgi:hypothetical protein